MRHVSIKLEYPAEFINIKPVNPLISKCQIKVCYVSDEPNRNGSVITKEVARDMANSLPGSPIVGYFNEDSGDFEEHNRSIEISQGEFKIKDTTKPYGFVDLGAKCWFQKFQEGNVEREYLMTEGYLWTGQYPECERVLTHGNNQSMELDEKNINAHWAKDENGEPQFFIINEAIISKLCILGEDYEPCFEGAQITKVQFSFDDGFKEKLFSMMNELKELLNEGGVSMDKELLTSEDVIEENQDSNFAVKTDEEKKDDKKDDDKEEICPECGKPKSECTCKKDKEDKKEKYNLNEIPGYVELFENYTLSEEDHIVDFGCGMGRLNFFINHMFNSHVTGVEINERYFDVALINKESYEKNNKKSKGKINFICDLAQQYEVRPEDNKFYFFNPFSLQIFTKVIDNILQSYEENIRDMDIIMYYPSSEYLEYLDYKTPFILEKEIMLEELYKNDPKEKFVIYSLKC